MKKNLKTDPDQIRSLLLRNVDDESGSQIIQNFQGDSALSDNHDSEKTW